MENPFNENIFQVHHQATGNPAAGAEAAILAPINSRSRLLLLNTTIVCDANAANRRVHLTHTRGATVTQIASASTLNAATDTMEFIFTHVGQLYMAGSVGPLQMTLPQTPMFLEGDTLHIAVENIQAGDQLSAIRLVWHLWPWVQ